MSTRARRTVEVRREEILAATAGLLTRTGLQRIRVADVAADLGVSTALVFYHFGNKSALVAEAFAYAFARDLEALASAVELGDSLTRLRAVVGLFDGPDAPMGWQLWIDACAVADREPAICAEMRRIDERSATAVRQVLQDGVTDGTFDCADPAASVARIFALNDGLSTAVTVLGTVTRAQLREWMAAQIAVETGLDPAQLLPPTAPPAHDQHPTD